MTRARGGWTLPLVSIVLCWLLASPLRFDWLVWVAFVPFYTWLLQAGLSTRRALAGAGLVGGSYYLAISYPLLSLSWWGWGSVTDAQFSAFIWHQKTLVLLIVISLSLWGGGLW